VPRWIAILIFLPLLLGPPAAVEVAAEPERLVVGVTAVSGAAGGILAAKDQGLFAREGLDVELVFVTSAAYSLPALLSGQLGLVTGVAGPPVVNAVLAGARLVWIAELLGTMPYTLVSAPAIARVDDLRGKRIGISRLGTSSDFAARFILSRSGLDPAREVTLTQVGELSVRLAALATGSIEATVIAPEAAAAARRLGLRELADTSRLGLAYPQEGVVVPRALVETRPDTVRRFLRAVVEGTHRYRTSRAEGLTLLRRHMKLADDAVAETYDAYAPLIPVKPYVAPRSLQFVLDELRRTDPRAQGARPEDFVDMRFVRELDESGFIDRLYAR
jgi:ABC-type nitrate/sulfonate/bicarbonate transport system substrate-binding protein